MKRLILALISLALGIAGTVLPALPGFPFLVAFLYTVGLIKKRHLLRFLAKFKGKRGSISRRAVAYIRLQLRDFG